MKTLSGQLPWTKTCFVCGEDNPHGLHLRSRIEEGRVVLEYRTQKSTAGYRNVVHGGIAMTLVDEVMTWAAIVSMRKRCVAAEMTSRLKHPIGLGQDLRVEGWVTRSTPRLCFTEAAIYNKKNVIMISAKGKYMPMPNDQAGLLEKDFIVSPDAIHPGDIFEPFAD